MRVRHSAAMLLAAATVLTVAVSGPAWAAAPSNDTAAGATAISTLPFDDSVDVSQATSDADDSALNSQCGAPATLGSVWYTYTAPSTGVAGVIVDVSKSSYSSGVIVAEPDGTGGWFVDTCGPGTVGFGVTPGTTYRILAFNDTPGSTGGFIKLHAEAAKIPSISTTVNPRGKVDRYGNALITGTYTCSNGDFVGIDTMVNQPVGRFAVQGEGWTGSEVCDGGTHAWSTVVTPSNGKFAGGKAATFTWAFTCGSFFCSDSYTEQKVQLAK